MYDHLCNNEFAAWQSQSLAKLKETGNQQMLNWMCLMGAMNEIGGPL